MDCPDWYPAWRREAFGALVAKNKRLRLEFRLGAWPRYDYDLNAGTLTFSEQGVARVVAEIHIAGTTSPIDWLWSWANPDIPKERSAAAELVRAFGQEHGIRELTQPSVESRDPGALGWELAAAMVRVTDALGAYRPPARGRGGALYVSLRSIAWVS